MNLKILSLFVKDYKDTSNMRTRDKCAAAAGIVGIISNVFLAVLKTIIGIITNSIAITADAPLLSASKYRLRKIRVEDSYLCRLRR